MSDLIEKFINQENREEIIKKLDESSASIELEDLFLFDLSPYYEEKLDESFFSKQLEFIQEKNKLSHNKNFSFTSEQIRIYNGIVKNKLNIVSAPTSFGKTMLIKEYIYQYHPEKVVILVPTNSLADELLDDFKSLFTELEYIVFDSIKNMDDIIEKSIFIGTQEKFYKIKDLYLDNIDLFVIDEAYKLTDPIKGSREVILNRSFIDTIERSNKIILLMPLVNKILGLDHYNFNILQSDYAPVAKNFISHKHLDRIIHNEIIGNESINLIYFNSPTELEKVYLNKFYTIKSLIDLKDSWIERVEEDFHTEWLPIKALKSGQGIHYGPMPKFIQKKVIELFKSNKIKNIFATNSIIEGVNTPTKNIYIYSPRDILGDKNLVKFKNLIGRAGRLGEHKVGNIYYFTKHKVQFEKANVPHNDINIQFVLEDKNKIVEINRNENYEVENPSESTSSLEKKVEKYLEDSSYSNIPAKAVIQLLNEHGFTISSFEILLVYIEETTSIKLLGIIGKVIGSTDLDILNVILNSRFKTFTEMADEIYSRNNELEITKIISSLINMIYNILPFKIIPLLNFVLDINDLYVAHTNQNLLPSNLIKEARQKKAQFNSKFIGIENPTNETLLIMNKLFEYGIPYQRVKPYLQNIAENLPDKFSIHDIRKVIFNNEDMSDLKIYFE